MSNLKLVPDAPTPLERMLLEASRSEQPSEQHKARLRAALGLGPMVAAPPSPPAPVAEPVKVASKSAFVKAGLGVGALALVGALVLTYQGKPGVVLPSRGATSVRVAASQGVPPVAHPPEPVVAAAPPVGEREREREPRTARRVAPPAASADLSEQIRLIEAARTGVSARDGRGALVALDSYASRFPRGVFGQEAMVLRIRALDQSGELARATALARSFVERFPQSPHVARLKPIAERGASR